MDRTFAYSVKENVFSIPSLLSEFSHRMLDRCCLELEFVDMSDFTQILVLSNAYFYAAGLAVQQYISSTTEMEVKLLTEETAFTLLCEEKGSFTNSIIIGVSPSKETYSVYSILDQFRKRGAFSIVLTDRPYIYAKKHADCVISTTHPSLNRYLPILDFEMTVLALISIANVFLVKKFRGAYCEQTVEIIRDASFALVQSQNRVEEALTTFAKQIGKFEDMQFVAYGADFAAAYQGLLI